MASDTATMDSPLSNRPKASCLERFNVDRVRFRLPRGDGLGAGLMLGSMSCSRLWLRQYSEIVATNSSPYWRALAWPTPVTSRKASAVDGLRRAMSRKLVSPNTMYAGTCLCVAIFRRTTRSVSNRPRSTPSQESSAARLRGAAAGLSRRGVSSPRMAPHPRSVIVRTL